MRSVGWFISLAILLFGQFAPVGGDGSRTLAGTTAFAQPRDPDMPEPLKCVLNTQSGEELNFDEGLSEALSFEQLAVFANYSPTARDIFQQAKALIVENKFEIKIVSSEFFQEKFGVSANAAVVPTSNKEMNLKVDTLFLTPGGTPLKQLTTMSHELRHILDRAWVQSDAAIERGDFLESEKVHLHAELRGWTAAAQVEKEIYQASRCNQPWENAVNIKMPTADMIIFSYRLTRLYPQVQDQDLRRFLLK